MAKKLIDEILNNDIKKNKEKNYKTLTISLTKEQYEALDTLSKLSKIPKSKIIVMALEKEGVFDINKINKHNKGGGNENNT
ncbi:ribbon-helix-helix domain-containing protein [Nitrosophilus labii]|uniref:ribbon-helix-helix domain-containing protein n=1 Tax=Nitrosophilus labii TaxID=2706014 RepID=UPI001656C029|nr:ribbon-helix-helix domain-containing protein [Nitrosophilus labii]